MNFDFQTAAFGLGVLSMAGSFLWPDQTERYKKMIPQVIVGLILVALLLAGLVMAFPLLGASRLVQPEARQILPFTQVVGALWQQMTLPAKPGNTPSAGRFCNPCSRGCILMRRITCGRWRLQPVG
jgi:hypothetical protein